ncbi:AfsR/SARP family transcriptional regulator [Paractinoplanes durhamensis]
MVDDGTVYTVSARKVEVLLAVLLVRAGQVVGLEQLMAEIWGEDLPRRATAGLHVYVSQLRKFLARPEQADSPIVTTHAGYMFQLGSDVLDVHEFQRIVADGRRSRREGLLEQAFMQFEKAIGMWRGPALGDQRNGPALTAFAGWAELAKMECAEQLVDCALELGRHREYVGYLYTMTSEHPFREVFYQQLMLALYRSGCRAEALQVYQSARTVLDSEFGLEPCRNLRDLQRAILLGDPQLEAAVA